MERNITKDITKLIIIIAVSLLVVSALLGMSNSTIVRAESRDYFEATDMGYIDYTGASNYLYSAVGSNGYGKSNSNGDFVYSTILDIIWVIRDRKGMLNYNLTFNLRKPSGGIDTKSIKGISNEIKAEILFGEYDTDGHYTLSWSGDINNGWGTTINPSGSYSFYIDNSSPTFSSSVQNGGYTRNETQVSVSDSNFDRLEVKAPNGSFTNVGSSSYTIKGNLDGEYSFRGYDKAGFMSTYTVNYDTTPPVFSCDIADENYTATNTTISVSASDFDRLEVKAPNGGFTKVSGSSYTISRIEGLWEFIAYDKVGNSRKYSFTYEPRTPNLKASQKQTILDMFSLAESDLNNLINGYNLNGTIKLKTKAVSFALAKSWFEDKLSYTMQVAFKQYNLQNKNYGNVGDYIAYDNTRLNNCGIYYIKLSDNLGNTVVLEIDNTVKTPTIDNSSYKSNGIYYPNTQTSTEIFAIPTDEYARGVRIYVNGNQINSASIGYSDLKRNAVSTVTVRLKYNTKDEYTVSYASDDSVAKIVDSALQSQFGYGDNVSANLASGGKTNKTVIIGATNQTVNMRGIDNVAEQSLEVISVYYTSISISYDGRYIYGTEKLLSSNQRTISVSNSGEYRVIITDMYSQELTIVFTIINGDLQSNINKYVITERMFIAPTYYTVKLPSAFPQWSLDGEYRGQYTNYNTYFFATKDNAQTFAEASEWSVCVIETNNGWLYRAKNTNNQVLYTNKAQLTNVIKANASSYVSDRKYNSPNTSPMLKATDIVMDRTLLDNLGGQMKQTANGIEYTVYFVADKFVLSGDIFGVANRMPYTNTIELYQLNLMNNTLVRKSYDKTMTFGDNIGRQSGYYLIRETDVAKNIQEYMVYFSDAEPSIGVEYYRDDFSTSKSESINSSSDVNFYLKWLKINNVIDVDKHVLVSITGSKYKGFNGVYTPTELENITLEQIDGVGGKYYVSVYDRFNKYFEFVVYIIETAPNMSISTYGSGETQYALFNVLDNGNIILAIDAKRFTGIDIENDDSWENITAHVNEPIRVDIGGIYRFAIFDNYGRQTVIDKRFTKNMPTISTIGVNKSGYSNQDVTITIPFKAQYTLTQNGAITHVEEITDSTKDIRKLIIKADKVNHQSDGKYVLKVYYTGEESNYNEYSFTMHTVAPTVVVTTVSGQNVSDSQTIAEEFTISYTDTNLFDVIRYKGAGQSYYTDYVLGTRLGKHGTYNIQVYDTIGNYSTYTVGVDIKVDVTIKYSNAKYISGNTTYLQSFMLQIFEQTNIVTKYNGVIDNNIDYTKEITKDGEYEIEITDIYDNKINYKLFVKNKIAGFGAYLSNEDKTPIQDNDVIRDSFCMTWQDSDIIDRVTYKINGSTRTYPYAREEMLTEGAVYTITAYDMLGNTLVLNVKLDKYVDYQLVGKQANTNKFYGDIELILSDKILIKANEPFTISITKDGDAYSYYVGEEITKDGVYHIVLVDELNNKKELYYEIRTKLVGVNLYDTQGQPIITGSSNTQFYAQWTTESYINNATVKINGHVRSYSRGELLYGAGSYVFVFTDILNNTHTLEMYVDNIVDYNLLGATATLTERLEGVNVLYMNSFSIVNNESLTLTITKDGAEVPYAFGETVRLNGLYFIVMLDNYNNSVKLAIRVQNTLIDVVVQSFSGNVINEHTMENFKITWKDSSHISRIVYKLGTNEYEYNGEWLNNNGKYNFVFYDIVGTAYLKTIIFDNVVDVEIQAKKYIQQDGTYLTSKFTVISTETITIVATCNGKLVVVEQGTAVTNAGKYELVITDIYNNQVKYSIEVIINVPKVDISHTVVTKDNIIFTVFDPHTIKKVEILLNGKSLEYVVDMLGENVLTEHGKYTILITDYLGNEAKYACQIDKKVDLDIDVYDNGVSDSTINLAFDEDVVFSLTLDGVAVEPLKLNMRLTQNGNYCLTATDNVGNTITMNFAKITSNYTAPQYSTKYLEGILIYLDKVLIDVEPTNGMLVLNKDGAYTIEYIVGKTSYSYNITIDTIPPTYTLSVENGAVTKQTITFSYESGVTCEIFLNGNKISTAEKLKSLGQYRIVLTDDAGNQVILEFEKIYTLNVGSIIAIVIVSVIGGTILIYLGSAWLRATLRNKPKKKKKKEPNTPPE